EFGWNCAVLYRTGARVTSPGHKPLPPAPAGCIWEPEGAEQGPSVTKNAGQNRQMNDMSSTAAGEMSAPAAPDGAATPARTSKLRPLRLLVPYATRYRGRIAAAFVALLVASMATLVVPIAVRRMIDFGFSEERIGLIDQYFGVMILIVA